ncbi:hypothetical protein FPV67DRAFT_263288 [Lyophyllum atratum]|nr:hypothetical protein FPV67DRAFT_263288 [Lyophyllum atratum]
MQSPQLSLRLERPEPLRFTCREPSTSRQTKSLGRSTGRAAGALCSSSNYNSRREFLDSGLAMSSGNLKIETDLEVSLKRRVIRPLPAIPSTPSPSSATLPSPRSPRPLPSPPSTSPVSFTSFKSVESVDSSRSTPLPPIPEIIIVEQVPQPTTPPRPKLPALVTDIDILKPPENDADSITSPLSPQMPTPLTAKRKRMSKLRRHLGEPILDEEFYARRLSPTPVTALTKGPVLQEVEQLGERLTYIRAAITVGKILDIIDEESDDSEEVEKDEEVQEDYTWVLENGTVFRGFRERRHSRRWMHEKRGQRWEESNYDVILQALRSL